MSFTISRRRALQGIATLGGIVTAGCSAPAEEEEQDQGEGAASATRELLARYKKFVVVVMENRSFDHLFGHLSLPKSEGGQGRTDVNGFKSIAEHANLDLNGNKVTIFNPKDESGKSDYALGDIDHEWDACHAQFNGGKNDGFVTAHQRDLAKPKDETGKPTSFCWGTTTGDERNLTYCGKPSDPMAYYTGKDTPVYHQLINEYALCDNWFSSVMGPTWPNRFYLHSGSAASRKVNKPLSGTFREAGRNSIFGMVTAQARKMVSQYPELLESEKSRLCVDFFADVPLLPVMFPTALGLSDGLDFLNFLPGFNYAHLYEAPRKEGAEQLTRLGGKIFGDKVPSGLLSALATWRRSPTFEKLCQLGKLPPVSYIEPPYQLAPGDDHPPHNLLMGQAFIASVYKMLSESPDWEHTLLIITYDEHGSFYDHVAPGVDKNEADPEFRQLGFRVPAIIIGKGVKRGFVDKSKYQHDSILSTLGDRLALGYANARVENAPKLGACIANGAGGSNGTLVLDPVRLSERQILESAKYADGQAGIVQRAFHGNVPYEAKRVFTDGMLQIFERQGVAKIGA